MDRARVQATLDQLQFDIGRVQRLLREDGQQQQQQQQQQQASPRPGLRRLEGENDESNSQAKVMDEETGGVRRRNSPRSEQVGSGPRQHTTLALISLDSPRGFESSNTLDTVVEEQETMRKSASADSTLTTLEVKHSSVSAPSSPLSTRSTATNTEPDQIDKEKKEDEQSDSCCFWPFTLLHHRPTLKLALVMFFNGCLSMLCAAFIIELELPAQKERRLAKARLQTRIEAVVNDMNDLIDTMGTDHYNGSRALQLLEDYDQLVPDLKNYPDEITWDMLSAQAFITSVQTTTGYGDIVPVTSNGKVFTLLYALVGIPVFMWYIVKLGSAFRMVIMKFIYGALLCFGMISSDGESTREQRMRRSSDNNPGIRRWSTETRLRIRELNQRLNEQYLDDKRFHPSTMGVILFIFLCCVSFFISYMEGISYFDSFYAAFITYSTIGFGDIDIFKISYRSSWFNFFIYGNFIHIVGYMIVSAWVSSILEKFGVRKY